MARTSPFSLRLTKEVRDMLEYHANILKVKPSVLASMVIEDCTEKWAKEYSESIFNALHKRGGSK